MVIGFARGVFEKRKTTGEWSGSPKKRHWHEPKRALFFAKNAVVEINVFFVCGQLNQARFDPFSVLFSRKKLGRSEFKKEDHPNKKDGFCRGY